MTANLAKTRRTGEAPEKCVKNRLRRPDVVVSLSVIGDGQTQHLRTSSSAVSE